MNLVLKNPDWGTSQGEKSIFKLPSFKGELKENQYFHFCADLFLCRVGGIKDVGITLGKIPFMKNGKFYFLDGYQWLTKNSTFNQSWNESSTLPYDRTANRLVVEVKRQKKHQVYKWMDFCERHKNDLSDDMNAFGDPENWYIFNGIIPVSWIVAIDQKGGSDGSDGL